MVWFHIWNKSFNNLNNKENQSNETTKLEVYTRWWLGLTAWYILLYKRNRCLQASLCWCTWKLLSPQLQRNHYRCSHPPRCHWWNVGYYDWVLEMGLSWRVRRLYYCMGYCVDCVRCHLYYSFLRRRQNQKKIREITYCWE